MTLKLTDRAFNILNSHPESKAQRLAAGTVGKTVRLLIDDTGRIRGEVTECKPVALNALPGVKTKTVVFEITVRATEHNSFTYHVRELPKLEVLETVDLRVEEYKERNVEVEEIAMYSPVFPGGPKMQTW